MKNYEILPRWKNRSICPIITAYPSKWSWGVTLKGLQKLFSISRAIARAARHFDIIALFLGNPLLCACCPHTNVPDVRIPKTDFKTWKSYSLPSFWWVRRVHSSFLSKFVNIWNLNIFAVFRGFEHCQNPVARAKNDLKAGFQRSKWVQNWRNM